MDAPYRYCAASSGSRYNCSDGLVAVRLLRWHHARVPVDSRVPILQRVRHEGSCHCGRVRFVLEAKLDYVVECNCSLCRRIGALWHGASDSSLRITAGERELALYQFNTMTAKHYSCKHCGVHPFSRPRLDPSRWAVNVRCIDGVDLPALPRRQFDGANWEEAAKTIYAQRK